MSYRPTIEIADPKQRAALAIYSTLLGGSMGSRLFDEIREQRGLAYSVHSIAHAYADVPVLQLSAGTRVEQDARGLPPDARHRHRAPRRRPDRGRGRAGPRLRRRRARDRVREHRRDRAPRRAADDRLRRGRRPRPDDRAARRGNVRRGERGRRSASPTSCRSRASARTRWRSSSQPEKPDCGGASPWRR